MELKSNKKAKYTPIIYVLIAPLWNWNKHWFCQLQMNLGSNRTFMELKFELGQKLYPAARCSNRTFMELKYKIKCINLDWLSVF